MSGPVRCGLFVSAVLLTCASPPGTAQQERHGRGYKAPPPTAVVLVTVEKGFNQKPMPNVSVIFRAMRDDKITANLETKTDPDGKASLDLLEVGSHVTIQVIAGGFATYATDFDLSDGGKQLVVKLERPRAQVSRYGENQDRPAVVQPGVQEHLKPIPAPAAPMSPPAAPMSPPAAPMSPPVAPTSPPAAPPPLSAPPAPAPTATPTPTPTLPPADTQATPQ